MPKQLGGQTALGNKSGQTTFITNDWRQLSAATPNEQYWGSPAINEEMVGGLNFDDKPTPIGLVGGQGDQMAAAGAANSIGNLRVMAQDIAWLKQDSQQMKTIIIELQKDRDNLRTAIRKLKVENVRIKAKLKRISEAVKTSGADKMDVDQLDEDVEYEDLRQYLLVGGPKDPFAIQFNDAAIQDVFDPQRVEHKTCERYYWYKMAETFDDKEAMQKILSADDGRKAEEAMKAIKNFNQGQWDSVKLKIWEDGQRLKFDQHRWIKNVLIKSGSIYIAVASQDKMLGTGWRKQREEASRTQLWDGENMGGKILMNLREEYAERHTWQSANEEQEALKVFNENKRNIWKPYAATRKSKMDPNSLNSMPVFPPPMMKLGGVGYGKSGGGAGLKKRRQM